MGCVQSSSKNAKKAKKRVGGGGGAGKQLPSSLTSRPSGDCLVRERAITARATSSDEGRQEEKRHGGLSSPEADLPINWNLRFKDLVILEHIANG